MKVQRRNEHRVFGQIVNEYLCPPDCPDCRADTRIFLRGRDGKLHLTRLGDLIDAEVSKRIASMSAPERTKLSAKFCKRCNRWGDHDDSSNHGE